MALIIDQQIAAATLKISYRHPAVGSSLFVQHGDFRFLMTAAHVCSSIVAGDRIGVSQNDRWNYVPVIGVQTCPKGSDVCVLRLSDGEGGGVSWDQLERDFFVGEDVSYCGFPLSLQMLNVPQLGGFPHPIVKSGTISAFFNNDGRQEILVDTINNVGFSGGPVVRIVAGGVRKIIGLVSSYKFDAPSPVFRRTPYGHFEEVPDYFVQPNSGFMRATCIGHAKDAALMLV